MSVQPPSASSKLYCTADDVAGFFDKYDTFDSTTNPSKSEVEARIRAASNWVDDFTGHAWRARKIENEYHNFGVTYHWRAGMPLFLNKRDIRTPLDSSKGDKIEIWHGDGYNEWVSDSTKEEGRNGDYWVNEAEGILYIYRRRIFFRRHKEIRLSYRFGKESVPQTIRDVTARRTAAHFLEAQQYRVTTPGNEEAPDDLTVAERWREICKQDLRPYVEERSTGLSQ